MFIVVIILIIIGLKFYLETDDGDSFDGGMCRDGEECVKVQITCCPCESGGEEKCVPASEREYYENKLKEECGDERIFCAEVYNCKIIECACKDRGCIENE